MPNLLLSGPAGAAKSALARQELEAAAGPMVAADFQAIVAALLLLQRGSDGRYPERPDWVLPIAEYTRRGVITGAVARGLGLVVTNSDGDLDRRQFLISQMGEGATERIVDPGEAIVRARLADPFDGALSAECDAAIGRWYQRKP